MERSESAGINPSVNGEQTSFQNAGTESFSASGDTSGAGTTESDTGIKGRVRNVASTVKDKASGLPSIIADGLEAGANALRQNRSSGAETTSGGSVALTNDSSIARRDRHSRHRYAVQCRLDSRCRHGQTEGRRRKAGQGTSGENAARRARCRLSDRQSASPVTRVC